MCGLSVASIDSHEKESAMTIDLTGGLPVEREYLQADCPYQPGIRDAVNVWIEEENGLFGMRIGVEATSPDWNTHEIYLDVAFPDGRVMSRRSRETPHSAIGAGGHPTVRGAGPVRFECVEPFKIWTVSFEGQAAELTTAELLKTPYPQERQRADVEFEIRMEMVVPPWIQGTLMAEAAAAMQGEQGQFISPRYEQLCRVWGALRVNQERYSFKGQGLRIRRHGIRKFEGFWGHCWQSCLFPSGKAFGLNIFPPRPGVKSYAEGFIFNGDGPLIPALPVGVPWLKRLQPNGDDVALQLQTDAGIVSIQGISYINKRGRFSVQMPIDFPPDFPLIQQSHVRYEWGREQATGMMERSTPANQLEQ
jgi:hypothetical protein